MSFPKKIIFNNNKWNQSLQHSAIRDQFNLMIESQTKKNLLCRNRFLSEKHSQDEYDTEMTCKYI